ncbi:pseudouridine synthase [Stachybotrys elegans]|uniref:tRNA pseudouridine(55) synthase n=1 Tax=Stachybotrys elegans TaxID=80388 RepID=A0A8K0SQ78_9HYPO|nr:pseudouridine synthase [Stachybotrys elegans]
MASEVALEGVFAVNKPIGWSSAAIVREVQATLSPSKLFETTMRLQKDRIFQGSAPSKRKLQNRANNIKIGHGGTLDPLATGVLILGIGSATKELNQFLECTKTYETTVLFGASTDTYDRVGRLINKRPYDHITREMVEKELESFKGKQIQIPPLYSALKMNGKPLYEYAREGKPIPREIEGRTVEVQEIKLVEWYEPGTHKHRWPTEEAEAAERNLAEQVWRVKKQQETNKKLTPEEKEQDDEAIAAHESFKRKFEERQDALIQDGPTKRSRQPRDSHMMSGALGQLPQTNKPSPRGQNLVSEQDEDQPVPWSDKGPPAVKISLTVTSGFYVRSFCHDLGTKLGSAGLMSELCRSRQSDFTVGGVNCLELDDLKAGEDNWGPKLTNILAQWNGEPGPGATKAQTRQKGSDHHTSDRRHGKGSDKRRHSPSRNSSSPPRKLPAAAPENAPKPVMPSSEARARSDDEKSWNGIDD